MSVMETIKLGWNRLKSDTGKYYNQDGGFA